MLQIEEIYRRSEQGVLKPFLCRAEDGCTYFVKGKGAGIRGLVAEFVGGRLAQLVGLPIPPFCVVEASHALMADCKLEGASELGPGICFASRQVEYAQELSNSTRTRVPVELQQRVFAFDWWIQNEDRHFGAEGGNPNLLWDVREEAMVVIDHHLAFDKSFSVSAFLESHIFRDQRTSFTDFEVITPLIAKFATALDHWEEIMEAIPQEWLDYLAEFGGDFDIDGLRKILDRYRLPDFWNFS